MKCSKFSHLIQSIINLSSEATLRDLTIDVFCQCYRMSLKFQIQSATTIVGRQMVDWCAETKHLYILCVQTNQLVANIAECLRASFFCVCFWLIYILYICMYLYMDGFKAKGPHGIFTLQILGQKMFSFLVISKGLQILYCFDRECCMTGLLYVIMGTPPMQLWIIMRLWAVFKHCVTL